MIKIVAKNIVFINKINDFKELAKPLIEASQQEEGCISYDLYEDIDNPQVLTFIEEWTDKEAIIQHTKSPHYVSIIPELTKLHEEEKEVRLYKIV